MPWCFVFSAADVGPPFPVATVGTKKNPLGGMLPNRRDSMETRKLLHCFPTQLIREQRVGDNGLMLDRAETPQCGVPAKGGAGLGRGADPKDLGGAHRAGSLRRWPAVLHGNPLGVLNLDLALALDTVSFHNLHTPSKNSLPFKLYQQTVGPSKAHGFQVRRIKYHNFQMLSKPVSMR